MSTADGAKSLIDASDRLILYIEVARIFGTLGYLRKAAFFSRQVAQLYLQQDSVCAAISAMKVLALTSGAYRIQSKKVNSANSVVPRNVSSYKKWHHCYSLFPYCSNRTLSCSLLSSSFYIKSQPQFFFFDKRLETIIASFAFSANVSWLLYLALILRKRIPVSCLLVHPVCLSH